MEKFRAILNKIKPLGFSKKSKLLDIGCGTCISKEFFLCDFYGIEPSKNLVVQHPLGQEMINNKKVAIDIAENLGNYFSPKKFDFIICVTAAHHFKEPKKALRAIREKLKETGIVVFSLLKNTEKQTEYEVLKYFRIINKTRPTAQMKDTILVCSPLPT